MVNAAGRGWIGIDLGTRSLKLAQVERTGAGLKLRAAAAVPRAAPSAPDDVGCRPAQDIAAEVETALVAASYAAGRDAACAISTYWCRPKMITLAAGSDAECRAQIAAEMESAGEDFQRQCFDYWLTGLSAVNVEAGHENAVAVMLDERAATEIAGAIAGARLSCRILDSIPTALARALRLATGEDDAAPAAILDWGYSQATISAVVGQRVALVRRLRGCGFVAVLQKAAAALGLDVEEVEQLLVLSANREIHNSAAARLADALNLIARQPLENLVDELQRTLRFLRSHMRQAVPQRLWLFGGGAVWRDAAAFLAPRIGIPVEKWDFFRAGIETPGETPRAELFGPAAALSCLAWTA